MMVTDGAGSAVSFDCPTCVCISTCTAFEGPPGDFTRLIRDTVSQVYTRIYPDSTKVMFDGTGLMTSITDRFGNRTAYTYDSQSRLVTIIDPMSKVTNIEYDANGLVSGISYQDPITTFVRRTTISVDPATNLLRSIQDPDGIATTFAYDASSRLRTVTDRRGGVTTYSYDPFGKLASVDRPAIAIGATTASPRVSYSAWQPVSVPTGPTATTPAQPVAVSTVTGAVSDPLGHRTSFTVDRWGQPLLITDPLGRVTTITRSGLFPSSIRRLTGATDLFTFVGPELRSLTIAGQMQRNIRYGGWGQPDSVGGAGWASVRAALGTTGLPNWVRVGSADSLRLSFTYDSRGRATTMTDSSGHTTFFYYDAVFGNLDSTVAPGGRYTKVVFDGYGRPQTRRTNDEPAHQTSYDLLNRATQIADGVNPSPTSYGYDPLYLTRVQDPKGQVFRVEVNALGWVTRRYDPADTLARFDSYEYDVNSNLARWTNRPGQQIAYTYDALDRLVAKTGTNTTADSMAYSADGLIMVAWNAVARDSTFLRSTGWMDSVVTRLTGQRFRVRYTPRLQARRESCQRRRKLPGVQVLSRLDIDSRPGKDRRSAKRYCHRCGAL